MSLILQIKKKYDMGMYNIQGCLKDALYIIMVQGCQGADNFSLLYLFKRITNKEKNKELET